MRYIPDLRRISEAVAETFGVRQVYGEPIERDGVLVIPAARVWSGAGAGGGGGTEPGAAAESAAQDGEVGAEAGAEPEAPAEGGGGGIGFARRAKPAGAFVVDEHGVRWIPALDVNRIVLGGQVALVLAVAVAGWVVARRRGK